MAKIIPQVEEATTLSAKDQFLFYSNTKKKTMRVSRDNMLGSPGVAASIPGVSTVDSTAPNLPQGLVLTSSSSIGNDGTEDIIITAKITPNADADLEGYSWYILEIDVAPVFSGGILTSGGTSSQTPTYEKSAKNNEGGYAVKVFRAVKANKWYLVKVAAVDKSGNYSSYTATNTQNAYVLTEKDLTPPGPPALHGTNHPTNPSTSAVRSVFLRWTSPSDSDLARIDIYRADGPAFTTYNKIGSAYGTAWTDSSSVQGTAYRYKLKAVDYSGNESDFSTVSPDPGGGINYVQITPGQIETTDVKDFAVTTTKRWNDVIVLEGDSWTDSVATNTISWNQHSLYYKGTKYTVASGSVTATTQIPAGTGDKVAYVYATIPVSGTSITYNTYDVTTEGGYPTLSNSQFMIATNVNGAHDLAWNALANAVIGSAWIQNASITTAKVKELSADKITAGTIDSDTITLGESGGSQGIIKSSGATSAVLGTGFWIQGGNGNSPIFAIGNLAGAPSMRFSGGALTVKGRIEANEGFFGPISTNGVQIDSLGLSIVGNGIGGENARLRANLEWNNTANSGNGGFTGTNGFYLGKAGASEGSPVYRFFIGNSGSDGLGAGANNLYWNGSALIINGSLGGNIRSGTTVGTAGDNTYGLTIQSGFGLRYYSNAGVLTITGGTANGAVNAAQIDLAGNSYANVNRGALVLSAGYVDPWPNSPSDINSGAIHFRTKNELVGLWRSNKTFEIYSDVSVQTNLYVGNADPAQAPFKVVSGVITATGANINGAVINGASTIGGRTASTIAGAINASGDFVNDIINARLDTENADILAEFSFGASGALQIGSYTPGGATGDIRISPGGITARNSSGNITFTLNGTTGAATFAGELSAPTGNIGGWTINPSSITGGEVTIDSAGVIRAGISSFTSSGIGFWMGKDTDQIIKFRFGSLFKNIIYNGSTLVVTGSIETTEGNIGGWQITPDGLQKNNVSINNSGNITLGTDSNIVKLSSSDENFRIWVGNVDAGIAPFKVSKTGVVTANGAILDSSSSIGGRTGATISGTINSNGDITTTSFNTSTRQILETFQFPTDDYDGAIKTGNIVLSGSGTISSGTGVIIYRNGIFGANNGAVKFSLDTNGNATFAGQLSAPTGNIGGWTIGNNLLYAGSGYYKVGLEADATLGGISIYAGSSDGTGSKNTALFYVTNNGFVKADYGFIGGAYVQGGVITVNGYDINTFQTYYNGISSNLSHPAFFAGALGSGSPAANYRNAPFYVEKTGALFATSATITGAITATSGFIGTAADGFAINSTYIRKGTKTSYNGAGTGVYIGTDGIGLATAFTVSSAGELTATSGKIANWTLAASKLSAGNIEIDASNGSEKIQAGPNGQNYVRISSAGIIGVDSVLGTVFNLPTNGAKPTFSSGEITLTKFTVSTSGIIETSSTAGDGSVNGQGVRINNTGIKGFKANDANPVFFLDATNGNITANGGTVGGWTLSSSALTGGNVAINSAGSIYSGKTAYTSDTAGFWLGYTSSAAKLYIGDASTYIKWTGTSLEVKGKITFSDTSNTGLGALATKSSVDLSTADVTNKSLANVDSAASTKLGTIATNADVTLDKVNGGLQLTGGGLYVDTTAQIRTNNITWTQASSVFTANQSGFFLGDAKAPNGTTTYRFFIGSTGGNGTGGTNYLYWDGSTLKVGGNIIGGTTVGTSSDTGYGLTVYSPYGIRKGRTTAGTDNGVLTFTGGEGNGVDFGAQIDLVGTDFSVGATSSGTGQLALSAGYDLGNQMNTPIDGAIVFRTAREYNDTTTTHIGSLRGWIQVDGLFRVYKNPQGTTNGQTRSDAPNSNAGNLQVDNSITIGVNGTTPYTSTKIYAASSIALQTDADWIIGNSSQTRYLYFYNTNSLIQWGNGAGAYDTNLYRSAADTLKTDDNFIALSVTTTSARRTKKNIKSYRGGLDIVEKLKPVSFNRKVDDKHDIGFIAEDVDKILSAIVTKNNKDQAEGIDYSKLTVVLVNAVKELSAEVKELKKKLKDANRN